MGERLKVMQRLPPLPPAPEEAVIAEMLRLAACAGFSPTEQESLREAISVWLPRFLRRSDTPRTQPTDIELALLKLLSEYARRVRSGLIET